VHCQRRLPCLLLCKVAKRLHRMVPDFGEEGLHLSALLSGLHSGRSRSDCAPVTAGAISAVRQLPSELHRLFEVVEGHSLVTLFHEMVNPFHLLVCQLNPACLYACLPLAQADGLLR